jgi:hypothetical protein
LLATAAVGLLLGNVVAAVTRGIWNMAAGGANDWVAFAAASRLLAKGSRCLYCAAQLAASETSLLGRPVPFGTGTLPSGTVNYLPFLNPPPVAFVITPLAVLPAALGFALFAALSLAAIAVAYRVLTGPLGCRPLPTFFAVFAVPGILGLALGQWAAILTLALVLALWALRPRPILAGLALSVLLIKPQYLWLVPVALVVTRKWRVLLGLAIGAAVIALSSLALVGPGEVHAWISVSLTAGGEQMAATFGLPGLVAGAFGTDAGYITMGAAAALAVGAALRWRRELCARPELAVATFACLSLVLSPHVLVQDCLLLAPAVALAARTRPRLAAAVALLLSVAFLGDLGVGTIDARIGFLAVAIVTMVPLMALVRGDLSPDPPAPAAASLALTT